MITPAARIDLPALIDSRPVGRLQITVAALCGAVMLLDGLNTQVIGYLGPALSQDWHLARAVLAPVFSAGLAGLMAGLLLIGPLSDKIGRKPAIVLSTLLFGCFTLLTAAAHGVIDLLIYRTAAGIGLGGAIPNALALTGEYCPKRRRATLVVIMFCGFSLGSILGGGLSAALIAHFGWRAIFAIGGVLPLALTPVLALTLPESLYFLARKPTGQPQLVKLARCIDPMQTFPPGVQFTASSENPSGVPVAQLFSNGRAPGTLLLWGVFFMNLMEFYFLQNWLPTIYTDSGLSIETAALITTLISAGGIAAGLLTGPWMDRAGPNRVLGTLYALGTVSVAAIGVTVGTTSASTWPLVIATFCAGFSVSGGQKTVNAAAVLFYPPEVRSTGTGWALGIGRLGGILGPAAGGWLLAQGWSNANIFKLAALPMLCATALVLATPSVPVRTT
ncbi:MAG TPA: MFS transporter [Bryobacteraceae bacterium]|nr:MFS transporter [Bryobacteraceae bacterium]